MCVLPLLRNGMGNGMDMGYGIWDMGMGIYSSMHACAGRVCAMSVVGGAGTGD